MNHIYSDEQLATLNEAASILWQSVKETDFIHCTDDAVRFLTIELCKHPYESFGVIFVNTQHQIIDFEIMFKGTINSCAIYPREVIKKALELNAAAMVLAHNHPSGICEPSAADHSITSAISDAARLFDIGLLDHFIVSGREHLSFAQRGLL